MTAARSDAAPRWRAPDTPIRIGISACLLGAAVRFDGGHKRDRFLTDTFGRFVEWVPVCPEVECGLGTPRETMRLVRGEGGVRLLTTNTGVDHTSTMRAYAERRLARLDAAALSGYVLKKDSPSCGLERVKVYDRHGAAARTGRGLFAAALVDHMPWLPVEEEGRLTDPRIRENFIERVFAYARLRALFTGRWSVGGLVAFHTAHKLLIMAHSTKGYEQLGRLVARARSMPRADLANRYRDGFMRALAVIATPRRHANVLHHMAGYFTERLDRESRVELLGVIDDFRRGLIPLVVPMTLVSHYVRLYDVTYLAGQVYLDPHPRELMLRNHV